MSIKTFKEILDSNNILYWLDFGTLLGIYRDNHLLSWDKEFDIGIFREDYFKIIELLPLFEQKGFTMDNIHSECNIQFKKNGLKFDINIYEKQDDYYIQFWNNHDDNIVGCILDFIIKHLYILYIKHGSSRILSRIPKGFFSKLKHHNYMNMDFLIPDDTAGYLKLRYGKWTIPVKNWKFTYDDKTICKKEMIKK